MYLHRGSRIARIVNTAKAVHSMCTNKRKSTTIIRHAQTTRCFFARTLFFAHTADHVCSVQIIGAKIVRKKKGRKDLFLCALISPKKIGG